MFNDLEEVKTKIIQLWEGADNRIKCMSAIQLAI